VCWSAWPVVRRTKDKLRLGGGVGGWMQVPNGQTHSNPVPVASSLLLGLMYCYWSLGKNRGGDGGGMRYFITICCHYYSDKSSRLYFIKLCQIFQLFWDAQ